MDDITRQQRSKELSMWLRHKPERGGLTLSKEGWAAIADILAAFENRGELFSRDEFDEVVRLDPKRRFEVEGDRVRARFGFSVELDAPPHPGMPPAVLYYGTPPRYLDRVLAGGIHPIKRTLVHLALDKQTAREVSTRREQRAIVLAVAAHEAHEAGVQFYPRGKGVWLSDPIPPEFLSVVDAPTPAPARAEKSGPVSADKDVKHPKKTARTEAPGSPRRRRPKGGFNKRTRPTDE